MPESRSLENSRHRESLLRSLSKRCFPENDLREVYITRLQGDDIHNFNEFAFCLWWKWKISKMIFEICKMWEIDTMIVMHACGICCRRIWYERMFWDEWRSLSCKESGLKIDVISYRGEFLKQVSRHVRNWYHWWSLRLDRISRFVIVRYFYEYSRNDFWMDKFIMLECLEGLKVDRWSSRIIEKSDMIIIEYS